MLRQILSKIMKTESELKKMKKSELITLLLKMQESELNHLELIERYQGEIAELVAELEEYER